MRLVKELMEVGIETVKIMLRKTSTHHNRTKHIDTRSHFIRDCVKDGRVIIEHVKTERLIDGHRHKSFGKSEIWGAKCENWSEKCMG